MTPLGKLLLERGIGPRALGEAIGIAEGRDRVPTSQVNQWIWGRKEPSVRRQEILEKLLKVPRDKLFNRRRPRRPRPSGTPELKLLEAASELTPDADAATEHLTRAVSQQQTLAAVPDPQDGSPCMDYRAQPKRRRAARATSLPARKAA